CFTRNDSTLESESQPRLTHGIPDTSLAFGRATARPAATGRQPSFFALPHRRSRLPIRMFASAKWVSAIVEVHSPAAFYQSVRCGVPLVADDNSSYGA
ncbi:hypothetical protein, partial [Burkholderia stagnalis]|uniref:hypothetical protein n=1 Tax=Burkholderia stagnalis TaxID=1503054 RepID=UPI001E44355E